MVVSNFSCGRFAFKRPYIYSDNIISHEIDNSPLMAIFRVQSHVYYGQKWIWRLEKVEKPTTQFIFPEKKNSPKKLVQ